MSNAHRTGRSMLLALIVLLLWIPNSAPGGDVRQLERDVQKPRVGQTVTFFAFGDGLSYTWNFGDGGTATGDTAPHAFSSPGTYTVKVTADGEVAYEQTITVRGNWAPNFVSMYPQTDNDIHPRVGRAGQLRDAGLRPGGVQLADDLHGQMGRQHREYLYRPGERQRAARPHVRGPRDLHDPLQRHRPGRIRDLSSRTWGTPFRVRRLEQPAAAQRVVLHRRRVRAVGDAGDLHGDGLGSRRRRHRLLRVGLRQRGTPRRGASASDTRVHVFTQPGTYAVRLTETDDGGASTSYGHLHRHAAGVERERRDLRLRRSVLRVVRADRRVAGLRRVRLQPAYRRDHDELPVQVG